MTYYLYLLNIYYNVMPSIIYFIHNHHRYGGVEMNLLIWALILVPILFAGLFLISNKRPYQKTLSFLLFFIGTILSLILVLQGTDKIAIEGTLFKIIEGVILLLEVFILVFLYWLSIKHKRWTLFALILLQTGLSVYTTFFLHTQESAFLYIDKLSLVMALIVNIVGTLILIFSNGYITHYEKHRNLKNHQKTFYFIICIFLAAMNGLIFSDSLSWAYFFWEVTTITSFVLISYNRDEEAYNSGFRALVLNMVGGICFSLGIILYNNMMGIHRFSEIIEKGPVSSTFIVPVLLLCIAGFAKSAQLPFQSWLLGAMVAPTPVSALLHSSTMVKAGVFLIIKLSPAYAGTGLGTAIAIYGGITFLACSAIAISQRNAKRILAYSTIANLGLIIASSGLGTSTAISAAILLIIFHALSKGLLFLCTGEIEHKIGSRDVEDMSGLIKNFPLLALLSAFGIISMILPPFGVLVTKWISIEASASQPLVVILLTLGSACTTVFWVKWLGKILSYPVNTLKTKKELEAVISLPLLLLAAGILGTSIFITRIFNYFVSPEVSSLIGGRNGLVAEHGNVYTAIGAFNDALIFMIVVAAAVVYLLLKKLVIKPPKIKPIYMCGENNASEGAEYFRSGPAVYEKASVGNIYLYKVFDEKKISVVGSVISIGMIISLLIGGLL